MQPQQLDSFIEVLDAVAEQYGKTLSDGVKVLYWNGLKGYDYEAVTDALGRHIRNPDNGMFMPKIADVVKMLQGSTLDSAYSAWSKVDKAVRSVGTYSSVVFDDTIIHRVINDMGGWMQLGTKTEDEWPFVAKEFENRYRGFKAKNEQIEYPKSLVGIFEAQNSKEGFKTEPPVLIGNKEQALLVSKGGTDNPAIEVTRLTNDTFRQFSDIAIEDKS